MAWERDYRYQEPKVALAISFTVPTEQSAVGLSTECLVPQTNRNLSRLTLSRFDTFHYDMDSGSVEWDTGPKLED